MTHLTHVLGSGVVRDARSGRYARITRGDRLESPGQGYREAATRLLARVAMGGGVMARGWRAAGWEQDRTGRVTRQDWETVVVKWRRGADWGCVVRGRAVLCVYDPTIRGRERGEKA